MATQKEINNLIQSSTDDIHFSGVQYTVFDARNMKVVVEKESRYLSASEVESLKKTDVVVKVERVEPDPKKFLPSYECFIAYVQRVKVEGYQCFRSRKAAYAFAAENADELIAAKKRWLSIQS